MEQLNFKKALFLSNFTIDMGDPGFRTGAYTKYLEPFANNLSKIKEVDIKYLISNHSFESIKRTGKSKINLGNSFLIDYEREIDILGFGDWFIQKSYNHSFNVEESAYIKGYFKALFKGWEPDLIVCWEFPTTIFRELFPNALVLDLMPGLFMRPPYPRTISVDPVGLYKDSVFKSVNVNDLKATDVELDAYYAIRNKYQGFYEENSVKEWVLSKIDHKRKFDKYVLVPLQISQYFGFYENCKYKTQFEFLMDILRNTDENTGVIVTQYISGFVQDKAINEKNIAYLTSTYPNFLYSSDFEKVDNISQYIVPWADATYSISSTIGLQAKFFNRQLISPSRSHLAYFADSTKLEKELPSIMETKNDHLMAIMLSRQTFLEKRLFEDPVYLSMVLGEMKNNKKAGKEGIQLLPNNKVIRAATENQKLYAANSPFHAANRQLQKLGIETTNQYSNEYDVLLKKIKEVDIVSFDVFDTLLCRAVFKPEDVFLIMQKELQSENNDIDLPNHIKFVFAQLRSGIERQLRRDRDLALKMNIEGTVEELTIREVYTLMVERFGGKPALVDQLIKLEQELEWSVLSERPIGKFLFNQALKNKKKVIIISDFIHEKAFVEKALENAGIRGFHKLYVSSEFGKKKHSGDLFHHVIVDLNIDPNSILHIGDNAIGDLAKASEYGFQSVRISSSRERALEILKERKLSPAIFDKSFFLRTSLSIFSEHFNNTKVYENEENHPNLNDRELIQNSLEFGFLALGPILFSFSEWIIEKAKEKGVKSIVFFARDCYLPYKIVEKILAARGERDEFKVNYIASSRKGLIGLNILKPEDYFKVRIDDYARQNKFSLLLEQRFGLDALTISQSVLKRWNVSDMEINVGKLTPASIYGIVYDHARENWESLNLELSKKRDTYKKYLKEKDIDLSADTLAIDFGYKGSIHRMLQPLFKGAFLPAFFMTYSDDFGNDPINNAESFYIKNINPVYKSSIMLSHNLIIETLVNEATGSLVEIIEYKENEIKVIKEDIGSAEHLSKIKTIHRGVLQFTDHWLKSFKDKEGLTKIEINSAEYLLTNVLRKPSRKEAEILKGLVFDNAFAGHANRYILSPNKNAPITESIWKEGYNALYGSNTNKADKKEVPAKQESKVQQAVTKSIKNTKGQSTSKAKAAAKEKSKAKNTVAKIEKTKAKPSIKLYSANLIIDGVKVPKRINSLRYLYRDNFVEVVSKLAKLSPSEEAKREYSNMIKKRTKKYVAAKLLHEYGGISRANLPRREKRKMYMSLLFKK